MGFFWGVVKEDPASAEVSGVETQHTLRRKKNQQMLRRDEQKLRDVGNPTN